jgi:CBS domain-containing protein
MRIKDVMSHPVVTCRTDMTLDAVVRLMSEYDCGVVPVVDDEGRLAGILTDRDICLAALRRAQPLQQIPVKDVMAPQVFSCRAEDLIESAERLMRDQHIRRVPVTDGAGHPVGVLAVDDLARMAAQAKKSSVDREFVQTLAAICRPAPQASRPRASGTVVV